MLEEFLNFQNKYSCNVWGFLGIYICIAIDFYREHCKNVGGRAEIWWNVGRYFTDFLEKSEEFSAPNTVWYAIVYYRYYVTMLILERNKEF